MLSPVTASRVGVDHGNGAGALHRLQPRGDRSSGFRLVHEVNLKPSVIGVRDYDELLQLERRLGDGRARKVVLRLKSGSAAPGG